MRTFKIPYHTSSENAAFIRKLQQQFSSSTRYSYNRILDDIPLSQIEKDIKKLYNIELLDSWFIRCSTLKAKSILESINELNKTLKETYPKQALTTMQTTYAFNPELIEKYADAVSDAIFKSKSIPDEDKINLIVATKEPRIAKNTINTLSGAKNADVLFDEIAPIVALKDTK